TSAARSAAAPEAVFHVPSAGSRQAMPSTCWSCPSTTASVSTNRQVCASAGPPARPRRAVRPQPSIDRPTYPPTSAPPTTPTPVATPLPEPWPIWLPIRPPAAPPTTLPMTFPGDVLRGPPPQPADAG